MGLATLFKRKKFSFLLHNKKQMHHKQYDYKYKKRTFDTNKIQYFGLFFIYSLTFLSRKR